MQPICHSCATDISDEKQIVMCQGFCKSVFHLKCVQLKAELWEEVKANSTIFWMCPGCRKLMSSVRFRDALGSTNDYLEATWGQQNKILEELKSEIKSNADKINQILLKHPVTPLNRNSWPKVSDRPQKRPRIQIDSSPTEPNALGMLRGNKETGADSIVQPSDSKFWLFLSRFSPHATVEEISKLVQQNLETDEPIEVVKLVRKNADLNQLRFVSFKVGFNPNMKEKAMQPASWQKGIYFREFVDTGRDIYLFRETGTGAAYNRNYSTEQFSTPITGN